MLNKKVLIYAFVLFFVFDLSPNGAYAADEPVGWLDSVNTQCNLNGWAVIKERPEIDVNVEVYIDGPRGSGRLVTTVPTDIYRSDVNSSLGISGNHGFAAAIPQIYHDGFNHQIYVYANNTVAVNISILLSGSPKTCRPSLEASAITSTPTPTPTPSVCPLQPAENRNIITFNTKTDSTRHVIYVSSNPATALYGPLNATIPSGNYKVTLVSFDDHITKPNQTDQLGETWFMKLLNSSGSLVTSTGTISDLPDGVEWKTQVVNTNLNIPQSIAKVTAFHGNYPDPSLNPNSITPMCAAFDLLITSTPTPTPTPTPTSTSTPTPTPTPTFTPTPSPSHTPTPTFTPTPTPSVSVEPTPTPTPAPSGDIVRPTVSLTSPSNGMTFSYRAVLTATAQDNVGVVGVRFYRDGEVAIGLEDGFPPYSMYLYATNVPIGQHTITARARDAAGNIGISLPVTVNVVAPPDTAPPYFSSVSAVDVGPYSATIKWNTNEPATGQLEFCPTYAKCGNNTPLVSELTTAHVINLFNLEPNKQYYYWVKSRDASGNLAIGPTKSFTTAPVPDAHSPVISITSPVAGSVVSGRINITADATDDSGVKGVKFYVDDGILIRTEDTYPPFVTFLYTDTLINGPHSFYAVARDGAGNQTTSARVIATVNNADFVAPFITNVTTPNITQFSGTVRWLTNEPATGQIEFCTTSSRCGNYTPLVGGLTTVHEINLSGLSPNTFYYFRIISKDAAGNTANSLVKSFKTLQ